MIVITANSLSASYFTYSDEYWTIYYVKPYARINPFLIGAICGCLYYSYQREIENPSFSTNVMSKLYESKMLQALFLTVGGFAMFIMVCCL